MQQIAHSQIYHLSFNCKRLYDTSYPVKDIINEDKIELPFQLTKCTCIRSEFLKLL